MTRELHRRPPLTRVFFIVTLFSWSASGLYPKFRCRRYDKTERPAQQHIAQKARVELGHVRVRLSVRGTSCVNSMVHRLLNFNGALCIRPSLTLYSVNLMVRHLMVHGRTGKQTPPLAFASTKKDLPLRMFSPVPMIFEIGVWDGQVVFKAPGGPR